MALNTEELRNPALRKFADDHLDGLCRMVALGAPILDDVDRLVISTNMIVGAYTMAAQPDVPRNVSVSHTKVGDVTDTLGTIVFVGKDRGGAVISEVVTPVSGTIAYGKLAFASISSITGVGWVIDTTEDATEDTITVGVGPALGLPFAIDAATEVLIGIVGTALIAPTVAAGVLSASTVDLSSGTYNGTKKVFALCVE